MKTYKKPLSSLLIFLILFTFTGTSFVHGKTYDGETNINNTKYETKILLDNEKERITQTIGDNGFVSRGILDKESQTITLKIKEKIDDSQDLNQLNSDDFKVEKEIDLKTLNKYNPKNSEIKPNNAIDEHIYNSGIHGTYRYARVLTTSTEYIEVMIPPGNLFSTSDISGGGDIEEQIINEGNWFKNQLNTANDFTETAINGIVGFIPGISELNTIKSIMEEAEDIHNNGMNLENSVNIALSLFGSIPWVGEFVDAAQVVSGTTVTIAALHNCRNTFYDIQDLSDRL